MAGALAYVDARNTIILCDIRNWQDKPCQNMEETVTIAEWSSYRRQCHSVLTPISDSTLYLAYI